MILGDPGECPVLVHTFSYPFPAGLTGSVTINNMPLQGFAIYSLEMTMSFFERYVPPYTRETLGGIGGLADGQALHFADEELILRELK